MTVNNVRFVELYCAVSASAFGSAGRLVLAKLPLRELKLRTENASLKAGVKLLMIVTFSAPASVAWPLTTSRSNPLPGVRPPSSICNTPAAVWV